MATKNWLEVYGRDPEKRAQRVRWLRRIKIWGLALIFAAVAGILYGLLWDRPATPFDAYALAVALATCLAAGFSLTHKVETDLMLCELLDELKR